MAKKTPKGILRGAKFSRRHSTMIGASHDLLRVARTLPAVRKIVLGQIFPTGTGKPRIKFSPVPGGLALDIRGPTSQQRFYLYTNDAARVQRTLEKAWKQAL